MAERMTTVSLLRLFLTTFGAVFVAELGDKTQLATMALSGDAGSGHARLIVFFGAALALVMTSAIGVLAGGVLSRLVSPSTIQRAAGALFVVLGAWMLVVAKR
jgi:putative Ca2+/H+ antiporter (TMEM165/GDT1 family)